MANGTAKLRGAVNMELDKNKTGIRPEPRA